MTRFTMDEEILIVGGGIGGLACAAALRKLGLRARVFEQADVLAEVGAGVGLWTNAVRCLRQLDVPDALWNEHAAIHAGEAVTAGGAVLTRFDVRALTRELGAGSYVVHRGDLHRALADAAGSPVELGARCVGVSQDATGVTLRFADGREARGRIAIGADGLRSAVRAALFGEAPPRYAGETCYRAVARYRARELHILREVQGRGLRCAVCPLDDERVYWWATHRAPEGEVDDRLARKARLAALFEGFAYGFPEALEATAADAILRNDLYDRPSLRRWSVGRVTLLGDAAHPTTPNLGQGACMAIEDAIVLARALAERDGDPESAFAAYERERMERCRHIVVISRRMGAMGSWKSPFAVSMRNALMRATPAWVTQRLMRQQIGYDAGRLTGA